MAPSMRACAVAWLVLAVAASVRAEVPPEAFEDAELADVAFADPDRGWAVGDRGVVWHTADGGRRWQRQTLSGSPLPAASRLSSVSFVDERLGWTVGGTLSPYLHHSQGLVLHTSDGGATWNRWPQDALPALHRVRFFDARHGVAAGDVSPLAPSGLLRTTDGGRTWQPLPGSGQPWTSADFRDPRRAAAFGRDGQAVVALDARLQSARTPGGRRPVRQVRLGTHAGWAVGEGGLVLTSPDGGASWHAPATPLPEPLASQFDFFAVAERDGHCWVAGSPGTLVFRSTDNGRTWQSFATGQALPIRGLTFLDAQRGWAVGALGTILATRDGGATWRAQRRGGTRLALLGIFGAAEQTPWELFAWQAGNEGFLSGLEILAHDPEPPRVGTVAADQRLHAGFVAAGGSATYVGWRFPLAVDERQASTASILASWERANDQQALARLDELLVRQIRTWRPDVIVTSDGDAGSSGLGSSGLGGLTNQRVLAAVEQAADATAHADQLTAAQLAAWRTAKVFVVRPGVSSTSAGQSTFTLATDRLAPRLGSTVAEHAALGSRCVEPEYRPSPVALGLRLVSSHLPDALGRQDLFGGLTLPPGGDARRQLGAGLPGLDQTARAMQRLRNLEQMLHGSSPGGSPVAWAGQIDELVRGLSPENAGHLLFQLAVRYEQAGLTDLADDLYDRLLQSAPDHALGDAVRLRRLTRYASAEWSHRQRRETPVRYARAEPLARPERPVRPAAFDTTPPPVIPAEANAAGDDLRRALELGQQVRSSRPLLFADPRFRFPLATAERAAGFARESDRFLHAAAGGLTTDPWTTNARAELWLAQLRIGQGSRTPGPPPKPVAVCRSAPQRPRLDGLLDEPAWQAVEPLRLTGTTVWLARDHEFLFVGLRCEKSPEASYAAAKGPRPRDAELTDQDHVQLLLDTDRDYAAHFRLAIDHRGWTHERCLADDGWNPDWFVARAADEHHWTIELALPFNQLGPAPPVPHEAWAFGVQRRLGAGTRWGWPTPDVARRPQTCGWLLFE